MDIIIKPIITEKSIAQTKKGFYAFAVSASVRKPEIKKAIAEQFKVDVLNVRTIKMPGKKKRSGKLMKESQSTDWKKAIVKIKKDQKITLFDVGV